MFGEGFKHMDSSEQLAEGYYSATITKAEMKQGNYGDYIQVEVEVEGHKNCNPHIFLINDSPKSGFGKFTKEQAMEMWCRSTTAFFGSFGIPEGNFSTPTWIGKKGEITVRQQKKNPQYNEIVPYHTTIKKAEKTEDVTTAKENTFKEDIPYNEEPLF
jgi:hypothetical protein